MKIDIVGASNFVNRMFQACGRFQWARELLTNSLEANASRVEFGIEWQAASKLGAYRRVVMDNGDGMDGTELRRFFSKLGEGGKPIGGVHENFGVGAKIATLPWNPAGVVVVSYKGGKASMIWICLDTETGDYELTEFEVGDARQCVIDPDEMDWADDDVDWSALRPDWIEDNGTIVVLLGSENHTDTVLGNPDAKEADLKGLSQYLNSRFWDLSRANVVVAELTNQFKSNWPVQPGDPHRKVNNRQIKGARYHVEVVEKTDKNGKVVGKMKSSGELTLDDERVGVSWFLWEGERPGIHPYAQKKGYIAIRYKDELFELTNSKPHFRWFGIIESEVQSNLTLILEPQWLERGAAQWGIHPDQSRNRVIFTGNGEQGVSIPLDDWGQEFSELLPDEILEAIRDARGGQSGGIEDDEYRKRLQGQFGDRWKIKKRFASSNAGTSSGEDDEAAVDRPTPPERNEPPSGVEPRPGRKRKRVVKLRRKNPEGSEGAEVELDAPVDVPRYQLSPSEDFEEDWHLAMWAATDPAGPTVHINKDSPILQEAVEFHQEQYADHLAEEVAETVRRTIGEVAACKVAHAAKLANKISVEDLDSKYRNEAALTVALMGLIAEEALIKRRLAAKLGRKRQEESATASA